ncbi:MAG: DUF4012 domain-containing protein, partial [Actinomycetota bacterium]
MSGRQVSIVLTILVLAVLLVADAVYVTGRLRTDLENGATEIEAGIESLEAGAFESARDSFMSARSSAEAARGTAAHPSLILASFFPVLADDADVARALPEILTLTSEAGLTAVQAGTELGGATGEDLARAIYRDGRVQLETIQRAEPYVTNVHLLLQRALETATDAPVPSLLPLKDALVDVTTRLTEVTDVAARGSVLLKTLPPLLGADERKRYLLLFQSPSEARGTGGLIGLYGILEFDDGAVSLTHVAPFAELFTRFSATDARRLDVDPNFLERYAETLTSSGDANRSPDFEAVAGALLQIYRQENDDRLDGVFATDPVALQELTRATGPLPADQLGTELGPHNTADVLLHDSYIAFAGRPKQHNFFLARIIREYYAALGGGGVNGPQLVQSFAAAASSQHIKIYSRLPQLQRGLAQLGAAGVFDAPNAQMIFHNNLAFNKIDYFLERDLDITLEFDADGTAHVTTRIDITNEAPEAPNALTLSYAEDIPPGLNWMELSALLPGGAHEVTLRMSDDDADVERWQETGLPTVGTDVRLRPGESAEGVVTYEIPNATDVLTGGYFAITLYPHATVRPDDYT